MAITLSNALVGSKIDYCNSLFYGVTDQQMQRLQRIQNTLCRIVTRTHRFSSITGPLSSLHWLPVRYRIQFKINLLTYKVYKTDYLAYLKDCVQPYSSAYNTRRSEPAQHMLNVPYYDYKQHKSFTLLSNSLFLFCTNLKYSASTKVHTIATSHYR